jgi:mannose-1-phosphate guanylyltransferase/mannose-6-phosphate isomerase
MAKGKLYGVILAGGVGSRFWPLSRATAPKQLLEVAGSESLLMSTIKRLSPLIPSERITIVTSQAQAEVTTTHLNYSNRLRRRKGEISHAKSTTKKQPELIIEPSGRNTAPAIGLAALELIRRDPEAVMAVLPADHLIKNSSAFRKTLKAAATFASDGALITFGIVPTSPETGYGYIKSGAAFKKTGKLKIRKVERFIEKPDIKRARKYVKDGGYYWNSGIFVWKASAILAEIKEHLPKVYKTLVAIDNGTLSATAYNKIESVSIDYGIMERSLNVAVIEATFPWSDMGSLSSLEDIYKADKDGNIIRGRVVDIGSTGSFVIGSNRVVATIGLKDMIIIDTPDATLVCPKDKAQQVKEVVNILKKKHYSEHKVHITVDRPWGSFTVLEGGDSYKLKKIYVAPGARLSLQMHRRRSEHWIVISGTARVQRGEEINTLTQNQSTYIPKGVKHRLGNPSKNIPLEIIEVQNGDYLEEDDIVRFEDDYARVK